jgi:hypothetical protein
MLAGLLLASSCFAFGQGFDHSHAAWDALLRKHVVLREGGNASAVRYAALGTDRAALKAYLDSLSSVSEAEYGQWKKLQQMAFLINAYNAFTVELILSHYPVKSIKDIGNDVFSNRWKRKFFRLLGKDTSLDMIEHEMLRKPGMHPEYWRVHFALNCASIGCPMLRENAYVAERLDAQLEEQTRRFLSDHSRNRYRDGRFEVSRIFDWYGADFFPREKVLSYYGKALGTSLDQDAIVRSPITFLEYDWTLNDYPSLSPR